MTTATAKGEPVLSITAGGWTRERIDLIKRTVCPQGISDDEFALFIEQCRRSGLDPLLKQAFCVKRRQNLGTKDNPRWVEKFEFQPAESGMLARAEDFPDYRGVTAAAVHEKDSPRKVNAAKGEVEHSFEPGSERGKLLGAWARLEREGRTPLVVWLDIAAYQQQTQTWYRMPDTMIEKCARVAALRKAYPGPFGGLYTADEPQPEHDEQPVVERPVLAADTTVDAQVVAQQKAPVEASGERRTAVSARTVAPEPSAEEKARRARADRIWKKSKASGVSADEFKGFVANVLGAFKPSPQWTDDDMGQLENAMAAEAQLARETPA